MDIGEHLFRREAGRMVATLSRILGVHNLALAEDVVQDAFCRALEVWTIEEPVRHRRRPRFRGAASLLSARSLPALQRGLPRRVGRVRRARRSLPGGHASCRPAARAPAGLDAGDARPVRADVPARRQAPGPTGLLGWPAIAVRARSLALGRGPRRRRSEASRSLRLGPELTEYHVEAAIAFVHATAVRAEDTDWGGIISLYERLM